MIRGIPPRRAGAEKLDVSFSYDMNGILKVTAILISSGKEKSIEIDMTRTKAETPDLSKWKDAAGAKAFRTVIRTAERLLSRQDTLPEPLQAELQEAVDQLKASLIAARPQDTQNAGEELRELLERARTEA